VAGRTCDHHPHRKPGHRFSKEQSVTKSVTKTTFLNGVDRQKLFGTIEAVKANASTGHFQFRLFNQWVGGGENRSRVDDYLGANEEMRHARPFFLINDQPDVLLSGDIAPSPVEYLLHALAGCLTTSLVYHAAERGIEVRSVTTHFEGDLDLRGFLGLSKDLRRGFSTIRAVFTLDADCAPATKQELIEIAQARSPVFDMVSNGLPVICMLGSGAKAAA
jgi:uncharacterized OsmC-like protein